MWTVHKPDYCEMVKSGKDKTFETKKQTEGEKVQINPFSRKLVTILTYIRE